MYCQAKRELSVPCTLRQAGGCSWRTSPTPKDALLCHQTCSAAKRKGVCGLRSSVATVAAVCPISHCSLIPDEPCCAHLAVHEPLELQLGDSELTVLFGQAPAGLGKVDLSSPHHAHVLGGLTKFKLVRPLQLEVLKAPEEAGMCYRVAFSVLSSAGWKRAPMWDLMRMLSSSLFICMSFFSWFSWFCSCELISISSSLLCSSGWALDTIKRLWYLTLLTMSDYLHRNQSGIIFLEAWHDSP